MVPETIKLEALSGWLKKKEINIRLGTLNFMPEDTQEKRNHNVQNLTASDRKVLDLLRRKEGERAARIESSSKEENPTMDDFWVMQGWFTKDGRISKRAKWKNDVEAQRAAIRFLVERVLKLDDVTKLNGNGFDSNRLGGLFAIYFNNSPYAAVSFAFPERGIQPWEMERVPTRYWDSKEHRSAAILRFEQKLGKKPEELIWEDFKENSLGSILRTCTLYELVRDAHPDHDIKQWEMQMVSPRFWLDRENVKSAVQWLMIRTGKNPLELEERDFTRNSLGGLIIGAFGGSPTKVVKFAYPDFEIDTTLIHQVPKGYWDSKENVKKAVSRLLKITGKELRELTTYDYTGNGFANLLSHFDGSPYKIAKFIDPNFEIDPETVVTHVPNNYWKSKENVRKAVEHLMEVTGKTIRELTQQDYLEHSLSGLLLTHAFTGSPYKIAKFIDPNFEIDPTNITRVPQGYWKSKENVRKAVEHLMEITGKTIQELTRSDYEASNLAGLLAVFSFRPYKIAKFIDPNFEIDPTAVVQVPKGYWKSKENVRKAVEHLSEAAGKTPSMLTWQDYKTHNLAGLLWAFKGSPYKILKALNLDLDVDSMVGRRVPKDYWDSEENRREAIRGLLRRKGKVASEIKAEDFKESKLGILVESKYKQSTKHILEELGSTSDKDPQSNK